LVEEDEEGNIVPVDALPIDLLQVDMLDSVLNRLREYDPALDAGEEIEPFDHEFPGALPTTSQLLNAAREWTQAHGIGRANFYSAREEPEALSPAVKAKVEALAALQTASRAQLSPSYTPSVAPAVEQPGGQVLGHYPKMAPLSASLAALPPPKHGAPKTAASLLGPPPKTRAQAVESPLPMDEPKDPTAPEATDPVITALAQQSTAITSLVAHLVFSLVDASALKASEPKMLHLPRQTANELVLASVLIPFVLCSAIDEIEARDEFWREVDTAGLENILVNQAALEASWKTEKVRQGTSSARALDLSIGELHQLAGCKALRRWAANWFRLVLIVCGKEVIYFKQKNIFRACPYLSAPHGYATSGAARVRDMLPDLGLGQRLLRAGEIFQSKRQDLQLPSDLGGTTPFILLAINEPKRFSAARHQAAKVDIPDVISVCELAFRSLPPSAFLWPLSPQTLRVRFKAVCKALQLPDRFFAGMRPLDLGSLRPGGAATYIMQMTESGDLVQRRGRWASFRIMSIYIQEVAAVSFLAKLP
ncbi:Uncharacterized protein SCF082_LOCUS6627, partial [Durusdinium trenchii]